MPEPELREHQDNQHCWCGDDHTWLEDEEPKEETPDEEK